MNRPPLLQENKIVLRQPKEEDIGIRMAYGISSELARMIGVNQCNTHKFSCSDAKKWYERILVHPCKWMIEYENKFVGTVSLRPYSEDKKAKFAIEFYDMSICGRGIGTQVTRMVLDYAFQVKMYHKVFLRVLEFNERAIKLYKKCGFTIEGLDREGAYIDGEFHTDIYMGLLKSEYEEKILNN